MIDIDFSKIRNHDGSQDNSFEELVCQLAHLSPPVNADFFVRKEGAGGDAGVECYWKLKDGSEHAWQAKYFTNNLEPAQWSQISESVETALNKHPKITKYYICLPRDWTDSRKKSKSGAMVNSAWNKWEEYVKLWTFKAKGKGMDVEFDYWGKHEISQMLQRDEPQFAGRALYWFNEPVIHTQLLREIADRSKESLGERFTPEFHLDLPITGLLDGLGLTMKWKEQLGENNKLINKISDDFAKLIVSKGNLFGLDTYWCKLNESLGMLNERFSTLVLKNCLLRDLDELHSMVLAVKEQIEESKNILYEIRSKQTKEDKTRIDQLSNEFYKVQDGIDEFVDFLKSKAIAAAKSKAVLLLGEAGVGKSHLLCDIALKRLNLPLPTVFVLGQHYSGGNPLELILEALDLRHKSYRQVLGALDAAGEAKNTRTLIIVDAINEGPNRDQWFDNISLLLTELSKYPNVSIILSCRSTYSDYLISDEIDEVRLVRLHHYGFSGFEHRAAAKYLAKQGISKPSAPIVSPEFSNPLFLKTCCKALKANGYTSFPKGLQGVTKLFDFYLNSVEKIINRKKKYLSGEKIVTKAVFGFAQSLYPDKLSGIPITDARRLIDAYDPKSSFGDTLTDLLIDEGILALDISPSSDTEKYACEVVRFTYERFSDFFIAQHILDKYVGDADIGYIFNDDQLIGSMIKDNKIYELGGIIEALGVIIPERYEREFIEFIPEDSFDYDWLFARTFNEVILWRSPESITEKTLELLNHINSNMIGIHNRSLDILLALATEPDHPWNADFLDKNLMRYSLPKRDEFWSTHIAISDQEENESEGEGESVLRTLIDWSLIAELEDVEEERLRLTALTLTWITTTSNRKVRDQATKSLSRIFSKNLRIIPDFIIKFKSVDDPYLTERLYAAIYGAVCNSADFSMIQQIADSVYQNVFIDGEPFLHILSRDYASGIMEFAYINGLLTSNVDPEMFRPPYKSKWPLEIPTEQDIDNLGGDKYSNIKNSLIGFIGDFGNYTMGCIHKWSPTSLNEELPETSLDIQYKFAKTLPAQLQQQYINYLDESIRSYQDRKFDIDAFLNSFEEDGEDFKIKHEHEEDTKDSIDWENLKEKIKGVLSGAQLEYFDWVSRLDKNDKPAAFSKKWAQRWVCKRAYELGWDEELFGFFDKHYARSGRNGGAIERVGKKYQWIALHELLARLSDNVHWIGSGYSDYDDLVFQGPWQMNMRDLDPMLWQRSTGYHAWDKWPNTSWWQPLTYSFAEDDLESQKAWLWDRRTIPSFAEIIVRKSPSDDRDWFVLRGFADWTKNSEMDKGLPKQNGWFRINSCIIHKHDFEKLQKDVHGENLCDPHLISVFSTGHQGFIKEFPWHPIYQDIKDWVASSSDAHETVKVKYLTTICEYNWESGNQDYSNDRSISIYLPSKTLIAALDLKSESYGPGIWLDKYGEICFMDPSIKESGPSYGLIRSDVLESWLDENDLMLVWLIGGEKQLYTSRSDQFFGRLVYNGIFTKENGEIKSDTWFIEEPGWER